MAKVVVIGAGIGGVPMAFELEEMLGKSADIQVVSDSEWFQFVPSNPWVAVNWRTADQIKVHLPKIFAKLGIGFNASGAKRIDPVNNVVWTTTFSSSPRDRNSPSTKSRAWGR
jgi:sulfide:quinone oxidoreductase